MVPKNKIASQLLQELLHDDENNDSLLTISHEISLIDAIRSAYKENDTAQKMVDSLQDPTKRRWPGPLRKLLRKDKVEFILINGLVYFRNRIFVPDHEDIRLEIVRRSHSSGPAGHPGRVKTLDLLQRSYWWPRMAHFVAEFVKGCALCFRTKTPRLSPPGFLKPLEIPLRPWADISIDHVVELPPCRRDGRIFHHILVVVDRLSKMRHFVPTTSLDTTELVECFIKNVYKLHGAPESIVSDRGSSFVSEFWRRLNARLSTTLKHSSAFHPQTDGQTEIVNAALNKYLRAFVSFTQDDWVDWLPLAEFSANSQICETTGVSPFFANYGYNPRLGIEPPDPKPPYIPDFTKKEYFKADSIADRFSRILAKLHALTRQSQERYEENANTRRSEAPIYREGDKVMISLKNLKTNRPKKKWDDKWDGPYDVLKVYKGAVIVKLPEHIRINNSFHTSLVRPWIDPKITGQFKINEEERRCVAGRVAERDDDGNISDKWVFEKILDVHDEDKDKNGLTYLIKWKYNDVPSWQPESDLKGCEKALSQFHEANPAKPGPPSWMNSSLISQSNLQQELRRSGRHKRPTWKLLE